VVPRKHERKIKRCDIKGSSKKNLYLKFKVKENACFYSEGNFRDQKVLSVFACHQRPQQTIFRDQTKKIIYDVI
jgi:hypothetical protein